MLISRGQISRNRKLQTFMREFYFWITEIKHMLILRLCSPLLSCGEIIYDAYCIFVKQCVTVNIVSVVETSSGNRTENHKRAESGTESEWKWSILFRSRTIIFLCSGHFLSVPQKNLQSANTKPSLCHWETYSCQLEIFASVFERV